MSHRVTDEILLECQNPVYRLAYGEEMAKLGFALALIRARKKRGLTQQQLADILGVKQAYIARLESGDANPTIGTIGRVFAAMWDRVALISLPIGDTSDETAANSPAAPLALPDTRAFR